MPTSTPTAIRGQVRRDEWGDHMAYADANGLRLYYEEYGTGPPLVLIHGGLVTGQTMWWHHIPVLAQKHRVLVTDSRGHGRTANPAGALSYELMADDYAAFIAALRLGRPAVVGYSDGGQIALELGLRHPDEVGPLVAGGVVSEPTRQYRTAIETLGFTGPDSVDIDRLKQSLPGLLDAVKGMHREVYGDDWSTFLRRTARLWHSLPSYSDADLARISAPTLVLTGDRDEMCSLEQAARLLRHIPDAELAVIPGSGHDAVERQRSLVLDVILGFLARRGGRPFA
jgi:pimeloyl-ACP methyl ester carboxylesterase